MTYKEELKKIEKRFKKLDKQYAMAGPVLKARLTKTGRRLQKREDHLKLLTRKEKEDVK